MIRIKKDLTVIAKIKWCRFICFTVYIKLQCKNGVWSLDSKLVCQWVIIFARFHKITFCNFK